VQVPRLVVTIFVSMDGLPTTVMNDWDYEKYLEELEQRDSVSKVKFIEIWQR
jgi:hypothetical protein